MAVFLRARTIRKPEEQPGWTSICFRSRSIWATVLPHALYNMGGSLGSLLQTGSAAASDPVDAGTAQALAVAMPMAFGAAIGCVALFLLRESRFGQVQEAWSGVFKAPDSGK